MSSQGPRRCAPRRRRAGSNLAAIEEYQRAKEPVEREDASRAEVEAAVAARWKLCETSPTTTAGLRAFLDLAAAEQDRLEVPLPDDHEEMMLFIQSLARSVQGLARANVVVPDTYQGDAMPAGAMAEHPSDAELEALSAQIVELWHVRLPDAYANSPDDDNEAVRAAHGEFNRLEKTTCEMRAHTLRGLIAKARAGDMPDGMGEEIAYSVLNDLVAIGTVQS
jgi:hypothetical protein